MRLAYYTPHFVNWSGSAANARMPMLLELAERHHLVLMRKKHQRERANSPAALPEGTFTQLNLENEWLKQCTDPPSDAGLSKTDAWMRWNLLRGIEVEWPNVNALIMEPFCVFPANQLFQMAMLQHYAKRVPVVMYDMDLGHGSGILGRMSNLVPEAYARVRGNVVGVTHTEHPIYEGLDVEQQFMPLGPWLRWQAKPPMKRPDVDLIFVGRDLFRRPRMRELVLRPSELGVSVRVHGRYDDGFKEQWQGVEWEDEVPADRLGETFRRGALTVVILQSKQAKVGFFPLRIIAGAIGGCVQLMDAKINGGADYALPGTVVETAEDVADRVQKFRKYGVRRWTWRAQLEMFSEYEGTRWVERFMELTER